MKFKWNQTQACEEALPFSLTLLANSLKAGLNLPQAIRFAATHAEEPLKSEWGHLLRDLDHGLPLEEALQKMEKRIGSEEVSFVIWSILILKPAGGNLIRHFDVLLESARARKLLKEKIKTMMAGQWLQALILGLMPIGLMLAFCLISPEWFEPLWTTSLGHMALLTMVFLEGMAFLWIRKITAIRV